MATFQKVSGPTFFILTPRHTSPQVARAPQYKTKGSVFDAPAGLDEPALLFHLSRISQEERSTVTQSIHPAKLVVWNIQLL
jgi:hypothetical protein